MRHPSSSNAGASKGPLGRGLGSLIQGGLRAKGAPQVEGSGSLEPSAGAVEAFHSMPKQATALASQGGSAAGLQGPEQRDPIQAEPSRALKDSGPPLMAPKPLGGAQEGRRQEEGGRSLSDYRCVAVDYIDLNPHQPRQDFDSAALEALAQSIQADGLLQPILVKQEGTRYRLIAGERRLKAYQRLGRTEIPAHVWGESDNLAIARLALIENLQREDLNPIEAALGYHHLIENFHLTQEDLAEQVRKPRATVANSLRLLQLSPRVREYVAQGVLSAGHAKALLGLGCPSLEWEVAQEVIDQDLSVRQTEQRVRRVKATGGVEDAKGNAAAVPPEDPQRSAALQSLGQHLSLQLRTEVQVREGPKGGKLVIDYQGQGELDRLLKKLGLKPNPVGVAP